MADDRLEREKQARKANAQRRKDAERVARVRKIIKKGEEIAAEEDKKKKK